MEHKDSICSLEYWLSFGYICSVVILNILEVKAKTRFSEIAKCSTLHETPKAIFIFCICFLLKSIDFELFGDVKAVETIATENNWIWKMFRNKGIV